MYASAYKIVKNNPLESVSKIYILWRRVLLSVSSLVSSSNCLMCLSGCWVPIIELHHVQTLRTLTIMTERWLLINIAETSDHDSLQYCQWLNIISDPYQLKLFHIIMKALSSRIFHEMQDHFSILIRNFSFKFGQSFYEVTLELLIWDEVSVIILVWLKLLRIKKDELLLLVTQVCTVDENKYCQTYQHRSS